MNAPPAIQPYSGAPRAGRAVGWSAVLGLHVLLAWALVSGTSRQGADVHKKPMEAALIREVVLPPPPPPPPPKPVVQPHVPVVAPPPPPYVPPAEVAAPTMGPSIAATAVPPATPPVIAPPPLPAPPAAPAPPRRTEIGVACPTQVKPQMPVQALRQGIGGVVRAQALIRDGAVREVTILSGPRVFHDVVRAAMLQYRCNAEGGAVLADQEFAFKLDE